MGRRQSDGKVHTDQFLRIAALRFHFIGDGKQRQNKEALVLGLILAVGHPPGGKRVILALIFQHVVSEWPCQTALQAGYHRRAVDGLDLFVSVVDCDKHNISSFSLLILILYVWNTPVSTNLQK